MHRNVSTFFLSEPHKDSIDETFQWRTLVNSLSSLNSWLVQIFDILKQTDKQSLDAQK